MSLLKHIQKSFPELKLAQVHYESTAEDTGMYAVSKFSGWILRVTFFKELAEKWENSNNFMHNVKITKVKLLE